MSPVVVNILDMIDIGGSEIIEHKLATISLSASVAGYDFCCRNMGSRTIFLTIDYLLNTFYHF